MRIPKKLSNILLFLVTFILTIAVIELILRAFPFLDSEVNYPYRFVKSLDRKHLYSPLRCTREIYPWYFDVRGYYNKKDTREIGYCFNQFGARWIEPNTQSVTGNNIIVVGDSFTFGFGLRYEDAYIYRLEKLLDYDKKHFNFINFSFLGADARRCLEVYKRNSRKFPHCAVIYGLNVNDLIGFEASYITCYVPVQQFKKSTNHFVHKAEDAIKKSYLVKLVCKRLIRKKARQDKIRELTGPDRTERAYYKENMQAIKEMALAARDNNADLFVVILPVLVDVKSGVFGPVYTNIRRCLDAQGIVYFDLSDSITSFDDSDLWIMPCDQHPNEIANRIFADRLHTLIKNKLRGHP